MKKQKIKNLALKKKIVCSLSTMERLNGAGNPSETSCWCNLSECACEPQDTFR